MECWNVGVMPYCWWQGVVRPPSTSLRYAQQNGKALITQHNGSEAISEEIHYVREIAVLRSDDGINSFESFVV